MTKQPTTVLAPASPQAATTDRPDHCGPTTVAVLKPRRPWPTGVLLSLVPAVGTSLGFGAAAASGADERVQYLGGAAGATVSALVGLVVMWRARPNLAQFGFRAPRDLRGVLWLLPALLVPVVVLAATGVGVGGALVPGFAWLALAAGFNEEIWFRGIVLAAFRHLGARYAVLATSVLFGVLHLVNLLGGKSPLYAVLQLLFAALFGVVFALLTVHTRSLWPAIAIHALYDFTAYLGGDVLTTPALVGLAVQCAILAGYAVHLWRRLPR